MSEQESIEHAWHTTPVQVWVDVDSGIAEVIRQLNRLPGIRTFASCQGHKVGRADTRGYVMVSWEDENAFRNLLAWGASQHASLTDIDTEQHAGTVRVAAPEAQESTNVTDDELSREIALLCGWVFRPEPSAWPRSLLTWRAPDGSWRNRHLLTLSLDACIEPGGPVEWLKARCLRVLLDAFAGNVAKVTILDADGGIEAEVESGSPARAICEATLAAAKALGVLK